MVRPAKLKFLSSEHDARTRCVPKPPTAMRTTSMVRPDPEKGSQGQQPARLLRALPVRSLSEKIRVWARRDRSPRSRRRSGMVPGRWVEAPGARRRGDSTKTQGACDKRRWRASCSAMATVDCPKFRRCQPQFDQNLCAEVLAPPGPILAAPFPARGQRNPNSHSVGSPGPGFGSADANPRVRGHELSAV
jgi:hypothetical protein